RFDAAVGVSPKMFARVVRFRRVLREIAAPAVDWSDVALSAGYFDQSHLIADFRQFAGTTPVPFFLSRDRPGA
ncbi:MAG: helix-turn-helix domain-containing protein, partial [Thermoanaerobaculia bacterium]